MARKRLIKGANATRVEERIARVPADVVGAEPGPSIFGALRAMEAGSTEPASMALPDQGTGAHESSRKPSRKPEPRAENEIEARKAPAPRSKPRKAPARKVPAAKAERPVEAPAAPVPEEPSLAVRQPVETEAQPVAAPDSHEARRPSKPSRIGPSDFSAAERAEIVRCCSDYRNRLPTYLLAVQLEVEVIDSVIDKCRSPKG